MSTLYVSNVFFESTQNTGIVTSTSNTISVTVGGIERIKIDNTGVVVNNFASINGGQMAGCRNCLINGSMAIDQRNNGSSRTYTAGAALSYGIDRWYGYCTGANVTGARVAGSGTTPYRYQFTGAASVTGIGFGQRIESVHSYYLAGKTATLSVDLSNSLLTSVTWTAYYANSTDTFGTLASPTRTQIATGTFTVTSTLTRYSTQISIPAAATTGIEIVFTVGSQTSGTWVIGNTQLELGSVASAFEQRTYNSELLLCMRYCEYVLAYLFLNHNVSTGHFYGMEHPLRVRKRTTGTVTTSIATYVNSGTGTLSSGTKENFEGGAISTAATGNVRYNLEGYITAEL